jgi:nucleoside-diphosphate-sugar epimerase
MILVVGASGTLGRRVAAGLAERGLPVRRLVHRTEPPVLPGAEDVRGDLTDAGSIAPALAGVETVVSTTTVIGRRRTAAEPPAAEGGTTGLVAAAERAGVQRFVHVSFAGVDRGLGAPLDEPGAALDRARLAVEQRLAAAALRSVIVRPDALQELWLGPEGRFDLPRRRVTIVGRGENPRRWLAADDAAALLVAVATEPDPPGLVELGGPQALSLRAAVVSAEGALGEHVRVQFVPRPVARHAMRRAERRDPIAAGELSLGLALDLVPAAWDDGPLVQRGIRGRPASAFVRQQAIAARSAGTA